MNIFINEKCSYIITFKIGSKLKKLLDGYCKRHNIKRSILIKQAIFEKLTNKTNEN